MKWWKAFLMLSLSGFLMTANLFAQTKSNSNLISETFTEPPVITSSNGVLTATLKAEKKVTKIGNQEVLTNVYNGLFAPPTLRAKPGDTINLTLVNALDKSTNVHTHGLTVSPLGNSDNVFIEIPAGTTFNYEIRIPKNQAPGTYWYHPHFHGFTSSQTGGGMSGALIIEGTLAQFPVPLQKVKERLFLLKDLIVTPTSKGQEEFDSEADSNSGTTRTINTQVNPTINIAPGETQYWRLANISANIYYNLKLDGHILYEIARDGNMRNRVVENSEILIPPAARVDVFVQGGKSGIYQFRTLAMTTGSSGDSYPEVVMATVVSQGKPQIPLTIPTKLKSVPDLRKLTITNRRTMVFSESADGNQFYINGKQFGGGIKMDHSKMKMPMNMSQDYPADTTVKLGSIEEWTLVNNSDEMHVFHIHQIDFQVIELNGKPVEFIGHQDTVNMPPKSTIKIILPFTDPIIVGKFVYHCHILRHEDNGMMATIEVVP